MLRIIDSTETLRKIRPREELNKLTDKIIGIAIKIHKTIGPGFIERIYEQALQQEFIKNKMKLHGLKPVASWSEILKRPFFILALKGKVFWPRMYKFRITKAD